MKDNYKYVIDNKSSNDVAKKLVIGAGFDNYINFLDLIIYTNKDENIQINNKCEFVCDIIQKMCGEKVILTNNQRNIVKSICLKLYKEYVFKLKLRNKNDDEILYDKELNPTLKDLYKNNINIYFLNDNVFFTDDIPASCIFKTINLSK